MKLVIIIALAVVLLIPITAFAQSELEYESVFKTKKDQVLTKLSNHKGVGYHFEFERNFSEPENNAYYELYKVIESKNNKHVGDLRMYVGSSQWWDSNALLQEDDSSNYSQIIKIKLVVLHFTDPQKVYDTTSSFSNALNILVSEWSSDSSDLTSDEWFFDSINNADRNNSENQKRENHITIENKEITVLHDDIDFGSMTIIVTENYEETYQNYVSEPDEFLEEILDFSESKESQQTTQSEIIQQQAICGEGTIDKDGICVVKSIKSEPKKSDTSFSFQNIDVRLLVVGIVGITTGVITGVIAYKMRQKTNKIWKIKDGTYYDSRK